MKKSIYKIVNNINGKIYIGQSKDPDYRFKQHCVNRGKLGGNPSSVSLINQAIIKYGKENFSFSILEKDISNYNERECYWINYFNCLFPNGYNLTLGGEEPPIFCGEKNNRATHSLDEIRQIQQLLMNSDLTFKQIADQFHYSNHSTIGFINEGIIWKDETLSYPLRPWKKSEKLSSDKIQQIQQDLLNTKITQKDLAVKYNVKRNIITAINLGESYKNNSLSYPLRKNSKKKKQIDQTTIDKIIDDIQNTEQTFTAISIKYNISIATVSNINKGKSHKKNTLQYPLRIK